MLLLKLKIRIVFSKMLIMFRSLEGRGVPALTLLVSARFEFESVIYSYLCCFGFYLFIDSELWWFYA